MNRLMKILVVPILILVIFFIFQHFNNTEKTISLKTYDSAVSYIENGWIPSNIPSSSKNISVTYDMDTSISNGEFQLNNTLEIDTFKSSLSQELISNLNIKFIDNNFKKLFSNITSKNSSDKIYTYKYFVFLFYGNKIYFFTKS